MNNPAQPNNNNETPSTEEVAQSTDSTELAKRQDKTQVDAAPKATHQPYQICGELYNKWEEVDDALNQASILMGEAYREPTIQGREAKLKAARSMAQQAVEHSDQCIALNNRQKQVEDRIALDKFAKGLGYPDGNAMRKALYPDSHVGSEKASVTDTVSAAEDEPPAAQPDPVKPTSKRDPYPNAQKVYQYLYAPDHADFTRGFTGSLRNLTGDWVKKKDGGSADMSYYRESTDTEKAEMQARRDKQTAEIDAKRAARAAKKA